MDFFVRQRMAAVAVLFVRRSKHSAVLRRKNRSSSHYRKIERFQFTANLYKPIKKIDGFLRETKNGCCGSTFCTAQQTFCGIAAKESIFVSLS